MFLQRVATDLMWTLLKAQKTQPSDDRPVVDSGLWFRRKAVLFRCLGIGNQDIVQQYSSSAKSRSEGLFIYFRFVFREKLHSF